MFAWSVIFFSLLLAFTTAQRNFAITDKVGQGNFAFVRPFAFAVNDNDQIYPVMKRSGVESGATLENRLRGKFAKHSPTEDSQFAFAFAKRGSDLEDQVIPVHFAKRSKFAFVPKRILV